MCNTELFHLVKRGAEVCFWEEILAPSEELGGRGQIGKVMSVCLQGVPNHLQTALLAVTELRTKTPSLDQLLARSWC